MISTPVQADAQAPWSTELQEQRFREVLRHLCSHLGVSADETAPIVDTGCLRIGDVDFVFHLNTTVQQLEFYGDCGVPPAYEEHHLYRHLLHEALANELTGLCFGLHPHSHHVVAKGSLFMPAIDEEGWFCTALVLTALTRIKDLKEKFSLDAEGNR